MATCVLRISRRRLAAVLVLLAPASAVEAGLFSGGGHSGPPRGVPYLPGTPGAGTLGYGPPGVHPGYQGFGVKYHLGYGYGGEALGVGAGGGYPYYAGPGYPHPAPPLRRFGRLLPYAYCGGPGYPTPDHPNFYGPVGPLVSDEPVVTVGGDSGYDSGFGGFTGRLPYPDSYFAPFTARAAFEGSTAVSTTPLGRNPVPVSPPPVAPSPLTPPIDGAGLEAPSP